MVDPDPGSFSRHQGDAAGRAISPFQVKGLGQIETLTYVRSPPDVLLSQFVLAIRASKLQVVVDHGIQPLRARVQADTQSEWLLG